MSVNKNTNNSQRPALGKGLASLLPNAGGSTKAKAALGDLVGAIPPPAPIINTAAAPTAAVSAGPAAVSVSAALDAGASSANRVHGISLVDIDTIVPNQYQPRRDFDETALKELSDSIRANGIIQPLVVRRGDDGRLLLIAGERRLRASKLAGLKQVPVVVRKSTDKEALELALIENVQREDLNCIDVALSYFQLIEDFHLTQEDVAARVGKDRASVANHLRLLKLPETIVQDLRQGALSFGHGRALLSVADPIKRMELRNKIVSEKLSVREAEKLAASVLLGTAPKGRRKSKNEELAAESEQLKDFSEKLGRALGSKVSIRGDLYRGSITIEYFSKEDLERLSEQLLR